MMRINLLGGPQKPVFEVPTEFKGARQTLVGGILAALVVIGVFLPYQYFNGNLKDVREEVKKEEAEKQRLEGVRNKIQQYQNQQRNLNRRINTINGLRRSQTGPVQFMNALGMMINKTPNLWLRSIKRQGPTVAMLGEANSVNQIADFIDNLRRSGLFRNVQVSESYQDDPREFLVRFKFNMSCEWAPAPRPPPRPRPGGGNPPKKG